MSAVHAAWVDSQQELIRLVIEDRRVEYGLALRPNDPTRVIASEPPRVQKNSVLFEYAITFLNPNRPVTLIAKVPRWSGPHDNPNLGTFERAINRGRAEWQQLSNAYVHFAALTEGLRVVRPVGYIDSCHALLVKKASGCELAKVMGTSATVETAALTRAGRWLSIFHGGLHELSNREWTPTWYATSLEDRKSRFQGSPRRLWEPLFDRVQAHAGGISPHVVPRSMLHGDFRLRHIWATPEGIEVLDFGNAHEGDCYADVAALVVELMMLQLGRPFGARRRLEAHLQAFLGAYFPGEPPAVFWFYVIDRLFKKWGRWLVRWNNPAKQAWWAGTMQQCVRLVHGTGAANNMYVSRWFSARILEALARTDRS